MHRRQLLEHRRKLDEIRNIMGSMKTLASIEVHKLDRVIEAQQTLVQCIEDIAADFLFFYPQGFPAKSASAEVVLVIGSERGLCGDFNDRMVQALGTRYTEIESDATELIVVGGKLEPLVQTRSARTTFIRGADIVEEIDSVLDALASALSTHRPASFLCALHHDEQADEIHETVLLPPFAETTFEPPDASTPPRLNLSAMDFFPELIDHYLYNALHRILHLSLMAENQYRIQHLERAIRHLDDRSEELGHRINALRQEEIIEEIEVMLLNAVER